MAAGITMLKELNNKPEIFNAIAEKTKRLHIGMQDVLKKYNIPHTINRVGSMISVHFSDEPVKDFASAAAASGERFNLFFHGLLSQGIYIAPSAFETWFISNSLSDEDIDKTVSAVEHIVSKW